jgi:large subunit ribosomal protein L3
MAEKTEKKADASAEKSTHAGAREAVVLAEGRGGILGVKAGMTQVYTEAGEAVAVTVIDLRANVITQVRTKEKDGYQAVQIGTLEKPKKSANKAEQGHNKAAGAPGFYYRREFRLDAKAKLDGLTVGKVLSPEFVKAGDLVDLTAICKGKGFQGGMKRYHMSGGHKSHGASVSHRQLGSIGNRADPGKCWKNKKMGGHMGNVKRTVQNVQVVRVDLENQLLLVHGSVPGPKSGVVQVRRAIKNAG